MAHRRKPLAVALALNPAVLVVELGGGGRASSLSLVLDGVHNLSDEIALAFLVLAYTLRTGLSGRLLRSANLFNSLGLLAICAFLVWQVLQRLAQPLPLLRLIPVLPRLLGRPGNWGRAPLVSRPGRHRPPVPPDPAPHP